MIFAETFDYYFGQLFGLIFCQTLTGVLRHSAQANMQDIKQCEGAVN